MGRRPARASIGAPRRLLALVSAVGVLSACSSGTAGEESSSQVGSLRATEAARLRALVDADTTTVRKLTAPGFQLVNSAGELSSREDYLAAVDAGAIDYLVFEPTSPITVRVSGDSAALRYPVRFDLVFGGDTRVAHEGWITELYERRHGQWRIAWEQATAVPNDIERFVESIEPTD